MDKQREEAECENSPEIRTVIVSQPHFFDQIAAQQDGDGVVKGVLYLPNPALAARYPEDAALLNDSLSPATFNALTRKPPPSTSFTIPAPTDTLAPS